MNGSALWEGSHVLFMAWQSCESRQDIPGSYDGMAISPLEEEEAESRMPELSVLKVVGEMADN